MSAVLEHLIVLPILLPLAVAATTLLFSERHHSLKQALSLAAGIGLFATSATLLYLTGWPTHDTAATLTKVYRLGSWPAPFGIVLVLDHLSALMLMLSSLLGFACLFYATARWDRSGPRFHALFLFLLMGVNGAFLTGDIFNLFVFFEVLLASSYGLALHGGGSARTTASLHYIAINIVSSLLFLIGVSVIYAVVGTLNLADLARLLPAVPQGDEALLQGGLTILGIAFLVKSAAWPLGFWLPATYSAAAPPSAAVFSILTKVGIYIILRFASLLLPQYPTFGGAIGTALIGIGMASMIFGIASILASHTLTRVAASYLMISSGVLLSAIGFANPSVTAGLLFYLVSSTLAAGAMYLIIEPVERNMVGDRALAVVEPVFEDEYTGGPEDDERETEIGVAIPAAVALLGTAFIFVALLFSGLPPLPSFIGKFALIDAIVEQAAGPGSWITISLMIISGLAALVTMSRAGIDLLWAPSNRPSPLINVIEAAPIGLLLATCIALVAYAGPAMSYMQDTARELHNPMIYVESVLRPASAGGHGR